MSRLYPNPPVGFILAALVLSLAASLTTNAQDINPNLGLTPYQSLHGGDIDSINLSNGNLMLHIPLVDYPQRGAVRLSFSLTYNSASTHSTQECVPIPPQPKCTLFWVSGVGPSIVDDQHVSILEQRFQTPNQGPVQTEFAVVTGDGAQHPLVGASTIGQITSDGTGFVANSSYNANVPPPTVIIDRNGVRYPISSTNLVFREDSNGNQISVSSDGLTLIDTLGRSIPNLGGITPGSSTTNFAGCTGPLPIASASIWNLPSVSGGTMQYKFCSVNVATNIPTIGRVPGGGGTDLMLQSIVLEENFARAGINDIDEFTTELPKYKHILKGGIHPLGYNPDWAMYFELVENPTQAEILEFLYHLRAFYGF